MTTFYMDYEGGNDANAGTSFALRWKTFASGATAARTAPGDTIRIMASPDPTSLGITGDWTDGPLKTTYAIVSSTNATPIVITLSDANWTAMAPAVGDTIIVNGHTTNTKANGVWELSAVSDAANTITLVNADGSNSVGNGVGGASGTVRKINNCRVKLTSALTTNIALCGNQGTKTNWTASANVTCTVITTDFKEGGECQQIAVAAGFTTGLAAYLPITSLDLSTKQQVSFWINQTAGTLGAANDVYVGLCTDALGVTVVHTMNIPALGALNQWAQISFDNAAVLNAAIQSVAFYVVTDNGAQTFRLDNITASKAASSADSIKLSSLVSKNTGTEVWYGLQSINGTRLMLDNGTNTIPGATPPRGYVGTTETVTIYKRETIKKVMTALTASVEQTQEAGTLGNLISYSGGWNRTDMSTQAGDTWWDGQNGCGYGINADDFYISLDKIHFTRYNFGNVLTAYDSVGTSHACCNTGGGYSFGGGFSAATTLSSVCNSGSGITANAATISIGTISRLDSNVGSGYTTNEYGVYLDDCLQVSNNSSHGLVLTSKSRVGSLVVTNNGGAGVSLTAAEGVSLLRGTSSGNTSGFISITTGTCALGGFTIGEATEVTTQTTGRYSMVTSERHDGGATAKIFTDLGTIVSQATTVHGSATLAWQFNPTSTNGSATYPLKIVIAKVACAASALVTVKVWFRRTNTGLTGVLICKGDQIAGVASDVSASISAAADTWEELTITFTPTVAGVVEIEAQFYGGTTYSGYVSDMTISQA